MSVTLSLTQSQALATLRTFLLTIVPVGVEVVLAQDNRVPAPSSANYIIVTPIMQRRLATNVSTYVDDSLVGGASARTDMQEASLTMQLDIHGPTSADLAMALTTLFRSDYAVDQFAAAGLDVTPLYTSDPSQMPFVNGSHQIESRWVLDVVLEVKPTITMVQQFANRAGVSGIFDVDAFYPPVSRLRIVSGTLCDPHGVPIKLRGWNWGRWGTPQPQDGRDNAAQGANCVRLPLRWWGLYSGYPGTDSRDDGSLMTSSINPDNLAMLDHYVRWASEARLWIILFIDSDCGQNGLQTGEPAYCDPQGEYPQGNNFWSNPQARQRFIQVWRFIANRYKNTPYIGLFELLPEPNPQLAADDDIIEFYNEVRDAVRKVAPGIPFLVGARSYNISNVLDVYNKHWDDVVYTGNLFLFANASPDPITNFATRLQKLTNLRDNKGVPIFVQQVGCQTSEDPDLVYTNAVLAMLNANNVPWTYWEYRDGLNPASYAPWYQDGSGGWVLKPETLTTITDYMRPPGLTLSGSNVLLPDGTPFYPFGTNQRWFLAKQSDGAYMKNTLGCNFVRIEFPWWQNGSAGDSRMDGQPGNIDPVYLAQLAQYVSWYTSAGLYVDIAIHSKCGRSGVDAGDPTVEAYCALPDDPSLWPNGRNFWTDPTTQAKWLDMLVFITGYFADNARVAIIEPLNEPDPSGVTDSQVATLLWQASDLIHATNPNVLVMLGANGGYSPTKIQTVYSAIRTWQVYTFDWFDQPGNDPDNPNPIDFREASLVTRLANPLALRQQANVPVWPQQFGSHYGADIDRTILAFSLTTLIANKMPGFQWEMRAPTVGPVAGNTTYGWIWDRGDGVDTIRATDELLMINAAAAYNALQGVPLLPGE